MQQGIRLAAPSDRHDQRVGNKQGGLGVAQRSTHHPGREQVNDGGHVRPPVGGPDFDEICHPLLVGPVSDELPIQYIVSDYQAFAQIFG
jgi:hypothetical protein